MTKDNSTGKPKDFYFRGQQMFDSLNLPDDDDDTQSYTSEMLLAEAYRCGFEAGALEQQAEPVFDCPRCGHVCSQREWVGLEAEDLAQIDTDEFWQVGNHMAIAMAVEAKLRKKNT